MSDTELEMATGWANNWACAGSDTLPTATEIKSWYNSILGFQQWIAVIQ